jgi:hypothetical protein
MIRIVTRLACAPRNRGAVAANGPKLIAFFEKHGLKSEGVFENFHACEIVHVWSAPSIAAYEEATAKLRSDPEFRAFAGEAAQLIETETKEYWRGLPDGR